MSNRTLKILATILWIILAIEPNLPLVATAEVSASSASRLTITKPLPRSKRARRTPRQTADPAVGQTRTLLPDGRLLLIGGREADGVSATVAIADPQTGEVAPLLTKLHQARAWHTTTMLPDGRVLVIGGIGNNKKAVEIAEILDPAAQTCEVLPSIGLTLARAYHTATLLTDGHVLIVGGLSNKGTALNRAELWDFKTETAITITSRLNVGRQRHRATLQSDGGVLIEGGVDSSGNEITSAEVFNNDPTGFALREDWFSTPDQSAPYLAGSVPDDNARNVTLDSLIALRFSKALTVETVNPGTITLNGPQGTVTAKVVPAENGRLAFITPLSSLAPGTTYTVTVSGPTDGTSSVVPSLFSFTTVERPRNPIYGDEEWIPEARNLRGDWRSNGVSSEAQSFPALQAEPGVTALAGQVLALSGRPLANVSVQIGDTIAQTDDTGRFLLSKIAPGHQVMKLDGRSASQPGKTYGIFKIGVDVTEGKTNVLSYTIWMPKLDMAHAVTIQSPTTREAVITNPHIPGLELRLPQQTLIRDMDGHAVTQISITAIPTNQPPFPLPPGVNVPVFFTIQPGGAQVIPPRAQLIYPNFTNQRPGTRIDFWNYDAEDKGWYIYGQGTVTPNGRQIIPDAGVTLYEFSGAMISDPSNAPSEGPNPCNMCEDGEPVDLGTGLFVYSKTDLVIPDVIPLALTRTYRPRDTISRPFGIGTTHPYEIFLVGDFNLYSYIDLILPDGGRVHYNRLFPGTNFDTTFEHTGTPSAFYKSALSWNGSGWNVTLKNGTVYTFPDSDGLLGPRFAAMTGMRDRNGNQLVLTRDSNRNLTRITSPNGRSIDFTYDASNRITQAKDSIGRVVGYVYDATGRLWKVTDVNGGVTEFTYDSSNRMTKVTDPKGIIYLTNTYDTNGRVTKQTMVDNSTYQFAYTLDGNNKVTRTDVTNPRSIVRRVTFNTSGYMVTDTYAQGKPEQQTVTYERQTGTHQILSVTDPLNRRTTYAYDANGNTTAVTSLAGTSEAVTNSFSYEPLYNRVASITDPLNHTMSFGYDTKGNVTSITDALNHQTTLAYNTAGQLLSITDALQNSTQFGYESGYLTTLTDPEGRTVTRFIDDAGRVLATTNALGHVVRYGYDALNQLTRVTDPLGGATSFAYDPNGNLLTVTDARNNVTTYTYNNMDRLTSRKDPLLHTESYEYDAAGNLTKFTDRRGKVTSYTYDNLDRLNFAGFGTVKQGNTNTYESTINYTYDAGNRLTRTVDSVSGTINLGYDNLDRLTSETTPQGAVTYTYDAVGRRTGMTVAGQQPITYGYDNANRLTGITQGTSGVGFAFDDANRLTALTLPNGVRMDYVYDPASQLTRITYKQGAAILGDLTYAYDAAGRRTQVGGSFARTGLPQPFTSATHNAANQLTQRGAATLAYDANGNLTSDGTNTYTWDARNQLTSISGSVTASFQYDAFGRRIRKTIGGGSTDYLYDGANIVQELSGATPVANLLTGGIDQFFSRTDGTGTQTALTDSLGSTLALTDSSGTLTTQYTYDPFGKTTTSGAASSNASQYTGRENDGTGLYYYRARYYSPALQRFVSEDPLGFAAGDTNLYAYVANAPINWRDPLGLDRGEDNWLDTLQGALDIVGFIPEIGDALDIVNAGISTVRGNYLDAGIRLAAAIPVIGSVAAAGKLGRLGRVGKITREQRLLQLVDDPLVSSAERGWIRNEIRQVETGNRCTIRNPPGKDLRHPPGRSNAKGYDYSETQLQDRATHQRIQHKYLIERSTGTTVRRP
jgi:RHS repeat-associated protein